jgi:uncharacterized lipoprotein YddW (UPF0748 family)
MCLLAALAMTLPAQGQNPRLLWLDPAGNPSEEEIWRIHECGFSGVVFPAFLEGETRYPSRLLPATVETTGLRVTVDACRRLGLSIGVYFQCFIHGGDRTLGAHLAGRYPEWISYRADGFSFLAALDKSPTLAAGVDGVFFDPGIPRFRELLIGLLSETQEAFDPDWVILDQVRYPIPDPRFAEVGRRDQPFGYHPAARTAFQSEWGVDPASLSIGKMEEAKAAELTKEWKNFRTALLDRFLLSAREMLQRNNPRCRLAVAGYPDPRLAREVGLQDWPAWIRRGLVEAVILPDNGTGAQTSDGLDLLPYDLRERVWLSGALPGAGNETLSLESTVADLTRGKGVLLFGSGPIDEGAVETFQSSWRESDAVPLVYRAQDNTPDEVPEEPAAPSRENPIQPETETAQIVALYGFEPDKPPFAGLTQNQAVERLKALGFNAVFGGSQDPSMRLALDVGGIKRFAEFPLFVGERNWTRRPESQPIAKNGKALKKSEWYAPVCPNQPWLRTEKLERLLRYVMERELQGVWLDFIRYPLFWEEVPPFPAETCFCPECLKQFRAATGTIVEGNETWEKAEWILANKDAEWRRWRADSILEYVQIVRDEVKKIAPNTLVGAFVLPYTEEENDGALYRIAGQDLKGFAERVDVLSPMLYFHQLGKTPEWVADRVASLSRNLGCPVLPIVQCYDQPTPLPPAAMEAAIRNSLAAPSNGTILFSQRHLETGGKWEAVRSILGRGN